MKSLHTARGTAIAAVLGIVIDAGGCQQQFASAGTDPDALIQGDVQAALASRRQFHGAGVGGACKALGDCRPGLNCKAGKCQPAGDKKADDICVLSDECGPGLQCGFFGFCVPSGGATKGEQCTSTADCQKGMYCLIQGISGLCSEVSGKKIDVGGACDRTADCLVGLACNDKGKCQPSSVTLSPDLFSGAVCPEFEDQDLPFQARNLVPRPASTTTAADARKLGDCCKATPDCAKGLICKPAGDEAIARARARRDNTGQLTNTGCKAMLAAGEEPHSLCRVQSFYSTPFPSDLRIDDKSGLVDLSTHPVPGTGVVGLDLAANVIKAIDEEMKGFSVAPSVIFRFTRPLDETSLVPYDPAKKPPNASMFFVNLDTGEPIAFTPTFKLERNKYVCSNWLVIQPIWGAALYGNTTYGVVLTDAVRAQLAEGESKALAVPARGDDLPALLADKGPSEAVLKSPYKKFAKLRAFLAKNGLGIVSKKVIAATVFTTQDVTRTMRQLRTVALSASTENPVLSNVVSCTQSPGKTAPGCESRTSELPKGANKTDPRVCPMKASADFEEFHARIKLPIWQNGQRPYLIGLFGSKGGGEINRDLATGKPAVSGYEDVCVAFSVPKGKGPMPAAGWPLLIYGHGTGGSHRSGITDMAQRMATLSANGKPVPTAVMAWDQPMHGPRRFAPLPPDKLKQLEKTLGVEDTPIDPGPLFYNFANPPAAKGNFYQGAADIYSLVRFAKATAGIHVTGIGKVDFDPAKVYYIGHSQGGTTGPLAIPWENDIRGAVFSGTGGGLVFSLLNKKSPKDATVGVQVAFQEANLDQYHPLLALMQYYFDEVDPLAYGPLYYHDIARRCGDMAGGAASCKGLNPGLPKHIIHTFGTGDTYTPPQTSAVFAASTRGQGWTDAEAAKVKLDPDPFKDLGMAKVTKMPAQGNLSSKDLSGKVHKVTGITVMIKNRAENSTTGKAYDGHFVAFKDKLCRKQVDGFLATIQSGVPVVPGK